MALLPVSEALERLLATIPVLAAESAPLKNAGNRVLAAPLIARLTQPPFNSSAMDGYALRFNDCQNLAHIKIAGEASAGHSFQGRIGQGEAIRIFTGAPVPDDVDTVIMQENVTKHDDGTISIEKWPQQGANIRPSGGDFKTNDVVLESGTILGPAALSLSASCGYAMVEVIRRPKIAVLGTGDELVEAGTIPAADQIVASNNYGLMEIIRRSEAEYLDLGIVADDKEKIRQSVQQAQQQGADLLLTSGGVSVGDYDYIQEVLVEEGMTLDFWKIAMRPGKPLMFGRLNGKNKPMWVLGLPGNPVSSLVCAHLFLRPIIARMSGRTYTPQIVKARLDGTLTANGERQHYIRASLRRDDKGGWIAKPARSHDSSLISIMAHANGLIIHAVNAPALQEGDECTILIPEGGL